MTPRLKIDVGTPLPKLFDLPAIQCSACGHEFLAGVGAVLPDVMLGQVVQSMQGARPFRGSWVWFRSLETAHARARLAACEEEHVQLRITNRLLFCNAICFVKWLERLQA